MSAANTLTFGEIAVGVSIFDYAGFILERVEYKLNRASYSEVNSAVDEAHVAICGSNSVADIYDTGNPQVYDMVGWEPITAGTPASLIMEHAPIIHDFSSLEGGGLLVPAQNIYIAMQTAGFAAAGTATVRVYYRIIALQANDYLELAQRLRVLST